jgi:dipeptidyl aminopeptidase/acylaminoacyl peptidase
MYFGALVDQRQHLWRQAFPSGEPEQITFDPTEEEGVAVAPDGKSLVTAVGDQRNALWIHDETGERQLTSEGTVRMPKLSRDGRYVFYLQGNPTTASGLRRVEIASAKSDQVLPGLTMGSYEVSPDDTEVAFATRGGKNDGPLEIWLASIDRRTPPYRVAIGGDQPSFAPDGALLYRRQEKMANFLHRVKRDGTSDERILDTPIVNKTAVSPDGAWLVVQRATAADPSRGSAGEDLETIAIPLRGGAPRRICAFNCLPNWTWSNDGRFVSLSVAQGRTIQLPLAANQMLPDLPASGFASPTEARAFPGARPIEQIAIPGPTQSSYVFLKTEIRRNLFRIQLR